MSCVHIQTRGEFVCALRVQTQDLPPPLPRWQAVACEHHDCGCWFVSWDLIVRGEHTPCYFKSMWLKQQFQLTVASELSGSEHYLRLKHLNARLSQLRIIDAACQHVLQVSFLILSNIFV